MVCILRDGEQLVVGEVREYTRLWDMLMHVRLRWSSLKHVQRSGRGIEWNGGRRRHVDGCVGAIGP